MEQKTSYLILFLCIGLAPPYIASGYECNSYCGRSDDVSNGAIDDAQSEARVEELEQKITPKVLEETFESCHVDIAQRDILEKKLEKQGRVIRANQRKTDPSLIRMKNADPLVNAREKLQLPFEMASNKLCKRYNLTEGQVSEDLPRFRVRSERQKSSRDECIASQQLGRCNSTSKFRTADGRCNNLNNPDWGMATVCVQRLMKPSYTRASGFRMSRAGGPLPEPRYLSLNLHYHVSRPTDYVTHMYMFFGQLLDHDLTLTAASTTVDNQPIECCPPENETHPQCAPIRIEQNDPFYSTFGVRCLNFVRSAICTTCAMGCRQQVNQVTSFIDGSFVYGNSEAETLGLRRNDGSGGLRTQRGANDEELLPRSGNPQEDQCSFPETNDICFEAGDPRANQHTVLTSLQTIFMREHNRLAAELQRINPGWDDDRLFQEARRILGAVIQVITYKEYLPITLGKDRMSYFKLWMADSGTTVYNSSRNPTMYSEFTTAAFRFGHSMVHSVVANSPRNSSNGQRLLRDEFFQPFELYSGIIGPLMSGASSSPAQWFDQHVVPDVTNFLYRVRGSQTGLDLAAFNINRGRDHGMPPYVDVVHYCSNGSKQINNFDDLYRCNLMGRDQARALANSYRRVQDVDLWPGILMEYPNTNAVVGPTAACILGIQFNHLKFGDRFYFEHKNQAGTFTYRQMQELRRITLSTIICLNSNVADMPLNAMLFASRNNPRINCNNVAGPNLQYWRE